MSIAAKVLTHSISNGVGIITFQTRAPKFLDAEFEKHRMISSNSSSDRAIPFNKMADKEPFLPKDVRLNEAGMQGSQIMSDDEVAYFHDALIQIHGYTTDILKQWNHVHKQHLNRYLLGFSWQDKVATANANYFDYFFKLRLAAGADPAMQELARVMKVAMENSTPIKLEYGYWHIPYVDFYNTPEQFLEYGGLTAAIKASVARCARVSYLTHDRQQPDIKADMDLAGRLLDAGHMSPFEHQATPMHFPDEYDSGGCWQDGVTHQDRGWNLWSANLRGWVMYRKLLE